MTITKIISLLSAVLYMCEEDISPDLELTASNGIEPLDIARFLIACEKKFKITIHDEDVHDLPTVLAWAEYIDTALGENDGRSDPGTEEERLWWYYR